MKSISFALLLIACLVSFPYASINAAEVATTQKTSFKIETISGSQVEGTNDSVFIFKPSEIVNAEKINTWKVRVYCDSKIFTIKVGENTTSNACGRLVTVSSIEKDGFPILLSNPSGKLAGFSFKFKAYDEKDKWLHTEKKSFKWK